MLNSRPKNQPAVAPAVKGNSDSMGRGLTPRLLIAGTVGIVALILPLLLDSLKVRVDHYSVNDVSGSARELTDERRSHCEAALPHYITGDRIKQIAFADIAEQTNEVTLQNTFLFNPCTNLEAKHSEIGRHEGTSLIRVVETVHKLVLRERLTEPERPVVVTLWLHFAEPGPGQPALDRKGYESLRSLLADIAADGRGAVAIIGPVGQLQNDLHREFQSLPYAKVCSFNAMKECVDWAFNQVR